VDNAAPPPLTAEQTDFIAFHALLRRTTPRVGVAVGIVAINVAVFVAMVASGVSITAPTADGALAWGANFGPRTLGGQPWRLLSNVFIHHGVLHLALNMLALWNVGPLLERMYGSLAFSALYLVAGVTGSVASVAIHPQFVSAGASSAIFGIFGGLAAFLVRQRGVIPLTVLTRLRGVALSFIVFNIVFGFTVKGIDNAAHVGGLLGGAAAGMVLAQPLRPGRPTVWLRSLLAVAAAAGVAAAAVAALPKTLELDKTVGAFSATEVRVLDRYNKLVRDNQAGKVEEDKFVTVLEGEIIPEWHAGRERLAAPQAWNDEQQRVVDILIRYADARERAFAAFAKAIHAQDEEAAQQSSAAQREAENILEELKASDKK
jgi:rhomboid protease GluP